MADDDDDDFERPVPRMEVELRVKHVDRDHPWRTVQDLAEEEAKSEQSWEQMDPEQKSVVLLLVQVALERMIANPEEWVPTSLLPHQGERLDVFVSIYLAEVDKEVVRRHLEKEAEHLRARQGLVEIAQELAAVDE